MDGFRWTPETLEAAKDVAEDKLTNQKIAEKAGVTRQALDKWKTHPDFKARVDEHIEEFRAAVRRRGLAILERRVNALNDRWNRMQQVIESRAIAYSDDAHGGQTGLLVRKFKGWEESEDEKTPVYEYEVDHGLLKELREHEKQAAQELGQWTEKKELTGQNGGPLNVNLDLGGLSDDELGAIQTIAAKLADGADSPAPGESPGG